MTTAYVSFYVRFLRTELVPPGLTKRWPRMDSTRPISQMQPRRGPRTRKFRISCRRVELAGYQVAMVRGRGSRPVETGATYPDELSHKYGDRIYGPLAEPPKYRIRRGKLRSSRQVSSEMGPTNSVLLGSWRHLGKVGPRVCPTGIGPRQGP